jgi:hypothetical protein
LRQAASLIYFHQRGVFDERTKPGTEQRAIND